MAALATDLADVGALGAGHGYLKVGGGLSAPTGGAVDWKAQAQFGYHLTASQSLFAQAAAGSDGYSALAGYQWTF